MMSRIQDRIADCHGEAVLASLRAAVAMDPVVREEYLRLERHWLQLAGTLEFAAMISGFLQWTSQRLEPP